MLRAGSVPRMREFLGEAVYASLARKPAGERDAQPIRDSRRDDEGPSSSAGF